MYDVNGRTVWTVDDHLSGQQARGTKSYYDTSGRVTKTERYSNVVIDLVTLPDGSQSTTLTTGTGLLSSSETFYDALGRVATGTYDAKHRILTVTDALAGVMTYTYNAQGQVTSVTDPLGTKTSFVYDAQGRQTQQVDAVGNGLERTTTYTWDTLEQLATVVNPLNKTTTYNFTSKGWMQYVTTPLNLTTTYTHNGAGQVTSETNPLSQITSYTYDSRARLTSIQNALGKFTTFTYDSENNLLTSKDANNGISTFTYDALNRLIAVTDPLGHTVTTVYDAVGNVEATIDALGNRTTFSYDALHQQLTMKNAGNNVVTYSYDAVGNLTSIQDSLNNVTTFVYDELHRRVNTIEPNGSKTTFIYDANSQMTGLIDPNSNRSTFVYDVLGRQTREIDALNKTLTYTYNAGDQLTQKKDRKSQTIDFTYDDNGRLVGQVWKNSGGTTTNTVTYTFDNADRLLTARDGQGAYTFTYDAAGQVLTQKDMWSTTLTFTYDNVGNRTKVQDSFSGVETSVYDAANRLTSRRFGGIGGTSHRVDLSYTNANQLENIKRYNAASGGSLTSQTTFTYDSLLRMTGIKNANGGGTTLSQYTYTYDVGNRLSTEVLGGNTVTFTYDVRSQLTGDGTASYGYDSAGNRNNSSQTIGTGNRLTADTIWNYTYDDEGNLTGKTSIASPTVTWAYTWDVNNRMVAAVKSAGSNLYTVDYKYDVFGNRIEQAEDVDGAGATASVTTRFAWEGAKVLQDAWGGRTAPVGMEDWNIWADLDGSNGLKVRYVRGDEVDQLFSRVKVDGTVASYLTDRMGSVRQMVDASGTLANTITYDGLGNVLSETDAAFGDRWKWTGREGNSYTGLQYNRARYYSGESGRWVSEDPIGFGAGYNLSRYVDNSSTNYIDPSGYDGEDTAKDVLRDLSAGVQLGTVQTGEMGDVLLHALVIAGNAQMMSGFKWIPVQIFIDILTKIGEVHPIGKILSKMKQYFEYGQKAYSDLGPIDGQLEAKVKKGGTDVVIVIIVGKQKSDGTIPILILVTGRHEKPIQGGGSEKESGGVIITGKKKNGKYEYETPKFFPAK